MYFFPDKQRSGNNEKLSHLKYFFDAQINSKSIVEDIIFNCS